MSRIVKVIQVKRSIVIIILAFQFGCLATLVDGYVHLRALQSFDAHRNYDVCLGVNSQLHRTVDRLMVNSTPERRAEILGVVDQGATDCEIYKITP